ncbi:hypothetical protein HYALB_00000710 [Hymenoscyphus albidus]|uniref:AA9 family lytic polysaccharide monooxygenase n=1 Tax=Hymenoscyphus albidus TaxID=595503 RepID=A0A9N9LRW9_9HELO|nr:hypothetical protein HYALB_00000710 [Hymenoscyphus albidus]
MFKHLALFALMAAPLIEAHYGFAVLTKMSLEKLKLKGAYTNNITDKEIRCNVGGEQAGDDQGGTTKTFTAEAGTSLGFKMLLTSGMHPGPASVYMSKAPAAVSDYDGSGDWFKIHEESVISDESPMRSVETWTTFDKTQVNFTIPKDVPDGEYLVRIEHIGLQHVPAGPAEFYISCAH